MPPLTPKHTAIAAYNAGNLASILATNRPKIGYAITAGFRTFRSATLFARSIANACEVSTTVRRSIPDDPHGAWIVTAPIAFYHHTAPAPWGLVIAAPAEPTEFTNACLRYGLT